MPYERDIFYDTDGLPLSVKREIIQDAFDVKSDWWADKLDCSESIARQKIEMAFPDIMAKFSNEAHFVVIHRKGISPQEYIGEVTFRAMSGIEYFLSMHLPVEQLQELVKKSGLKPLS